MDSKRKLLFFKLIMAGISTFFGLALVEVFLQISTPEMMMTIQKVENTKLIYDHIPNFKGESAGWNFRYNSIGLRGPEAAVKSSKKRILFIGDSITDGRPAEDDTFSWIVEKLLVNDGFDVETLNAGVTGFNSNQILENLKIRIPQLEPDIVVYGFCLNDILEPGSVDETGGLKNTSLPSLGQLLRRSKIIQGLGRAIQNKFIQSGKKPPIGDYANYGQRVQAQFSESEKVEPLLATLSEMVEVSNQSNIPFVIVLFPLSTQYLGDDRKPQELVRQTVEGAGGIVIDLYDSLEKAGGAMAYVPNDPVHPHDQGHHAVAAEIAAALKAQILSKASADTSVSTS